MHESKNSVIGLIDNCNLEEHHVVTKKLHLNNKGNSAFAKIFYILLTAELQDEIRVRHLLKDKPQSKFSDMRDSGEAKELAQFKMYNENKLVIAHLNINCLRNKFELLTEKIKGNARIL